VEATMSETGWVSDAYYARFGHPPVLYRRGTVKGLQALERGTPLTADELTPEQAEAHDKLPHYCGPCRPQACRAIAAPAVRERTTMFALAFDGKPRDTCNIVPCSRRRRRATSALSLTSPEMREHATAS
jgi:hypothetical protein